MRLFRIGHHLNYRRSTHGSRFSRCLAGGQRFRNPNGRKDAGGTTTEIKFARLPGFQAFLPQLQELFESDVKDREELATVQEGMP